MRKSALRRLILTMLACAAPCVATVTHAFTGANHKDITYAASQTFQRAGTLALSQVNIIMAGNWSVDDIETYNHAQERHFTSSFFKDGIEAIENEWRIIERTGNQVVALLAFGRLLHAVQDFYAHSNWVELHRMSSPIPLWDMRTVRRDLWSGFWPNDDPSFARIPGTPNHAASAKDEASGAGATVVASGPNKGRNAFELAKEAATRATHEEFQRFVPMLAAKAVYRFDDVLKLPGGRAYLFAGDHCLRYDVAANALSSDQPVEYLRENWRGLWSDGIDASVTWDQGKVYFFKGGEYIRYDVAQRAADPGYPRAISRHWRGLWASGIDAAVNWGNGKVYFFKGGEYMRFDIASDRVDPGFPRRIADGWPGLWADGVDAAVNWENGKVIFIKGREYIRWDIKDGIESGFPRPLHGDWGGL